MKCIFGKQTESPHGRGYMDIFIPLHLFIRRLTTLFIAFYLNVWGRRQSDNHARKLAFSAYMIHDPIKRIKRKGKTSKKKRQKHTRRKPGVCIVYTLCLFRENCTLLLSEKLSLSFSFVEMLPSTAWLNAEVCCYGGATLKRGLSSEPSCFSYI